MLDLPGTYSLRARSPDEVVTRDAVLGRLAGEAPPDVLVCVADATNLRLVLRLILELKAGRAGRWCWRSTCTTSPSARACASTSSGLSRELGCPIVTTVATRKRGIEDLIAQVDALVAAGDARRRERLARAQRRPRSATPTARPSAS